MTLELNGNNVLFKPYARSQDARSCGGWYWGGGRGEAGLSPLPGLRHTPRWSQATWLSSTCGEQKNPGMPFSSKGSDILRSIIWLWPWKKKLRHILAIPCLFLYLWDKYCRSTYSIPAGRDLPSRCRLRQESSLPNSGVWHWWPVLSVQRMTSICRLALWLVQTLGGNVGYYLSSLINTPVILTLQVCKSEHVMRTA